MVFPSRQQNNFKRNEKTHTSLLMKRRCSRHNVNFLYSEISLIGKANDATSASSLFNFRTIALRTAEFLASFLFNLSNSTNDTNFLVSLAESSASKVKSRSSIVLLLLFKRSSLYSCPSPFLN